MTTTEAPPGRTGKRRAVLIVSLVAILVLGAIGASLLLLTGNGDDSDGSGETPAATGQLAAATRYRDPQGAYSLEVDPQWRVPTSTAGGNVETWYTQTGTADFRDNVTIVAQPVGEVDLDQYLQLVIDQAPKSVNDFKLREFRVVTIPTESKTKVPKSLGVVAYEGRKGDQTYGFFFVASVEDGDAVVATLTTDQDRFNDVRAKVAPYLMTLRQA
jgi:hypothetical protein